MSRNARYNPLEREAVNALEKVILKKFKWVFREQPIVDVGIDALVEESINGNPTGKFLAVQIKSGKSHFYEKENTLTYYISGVHYHYWTSIDMPIILVLYDPENECLYWKEVNQETTNETKRGWKIEIPKTQILNDTKLPKLKKVLHSFQSKTNFWNRDLTLTNHDFYEYIDNLVKISYTTDSLNYQNQSYY